MTDGRLARGESTRTAILCAATKVVATKGIASLTHRAVAAQAEVSHSLVTYHFLTVKDLRRATLIYAGERLESQLGQLLDSLVNPQDVPFVAAELATHMITDLRNETIAVCEMMVAAAREEDLRPIMGALIQHLADLLTPLAEERNRVVSASNAFLGHVLINMALGNDHDPAVFRAGIVRLVEHFDPHRRS